MPRSWTRLADPSCPSLEQCGKAQAGLGKVLWESSTPPFCLLHNQESTFEIPRPEQVQAKKSSLLPVSKWTAESCSQNWSPPGGNCCRVTRKVFRDNKHPILGRPLLFSCAVGLWQKNNSIGVLNGLNSLRGI